jgi:hypothetical protein
MGVDLGILKVKSVESARTAALNEISENRGRTMREIAINPSIFFIFVLSSPLKHE